MVKMLLESGADINAPGYIGNALQLASKNGYEKIVEVLLINGADVNVTNPKERRTALQLALWGGYENIVKTLLEKGAEINAQTGDFGNPLQLASQWGHEKIVEMLLVNGADVNATSSEEPRNALQLASI